LIHRIRPDWRLRAQDCFCSSLCGNQPGADVLYRGYLGRRAAIYAAVKLFLYTLAGSLLMPPGDPVAGQLLPHVRVPDITALVNSGASAIPWYTERLLFLGFFAAFAVKVPICRCIVAARCPRPGADGWFRHSGRRDAETRHVCLIRFCLGFFAASLH